MKESNTHAGNATIKQPQNQVLLITKEQCMKRSNTCAGNATIKKQLRSHILLNRKEQYMKDTNPNLVKHKRAIHEGVKYPCRQCEHKASSIQFRRSILENLNKSRKKIGNLDLI